MIFFFLQIGFKISKVIPYLPPTKEKFLKCGGIWCQYTSLGVTVKRLIYDNSCLRKASSFSFMCQAMQYPQHQTGFNNGFNFYSLLQMPLTGSIHQETEGRTNYRDDRTLYVRFPQSLSVREKSYVQPMAPTAVDIRFPRLSPGNAAK